MSIITLLLGWTGMPPWATEIVATALVAAAGVGATAYYNHHERSIGAAAVQAVIQKDDQKQEVHNAVVATQDADTIKREADDYAKALATAPVAPVRVYFTAPRPVDLPAPASPSGSADEAAAVGSADHGNSVSDEPFGPELQKVGHDDAAQIAGLEDYITNVCRPAK